MLKNLPLLLLLVPAAALAQDGTRIGGPVAGFVFDGAQQAIRPIVGVPGAAYLGAPIVTGLDRAAISPDGGSALAVRGSRTVLITGLRSGDAAIAPLDAIEDVDRIAWSPEGALAAVYSAAHRQAQIIRGLPAAPAPQTPFPVDGTVSVFAISSAGDAIVGTESGVSRTGGDAAPQLLAPAIQVSAVAFHGADLFVADAAGRILSIENFAGAPAVSLFTDTVAAPVGLQVSADGARLLVAAAQPNRLLAFDIAGRNAIAETQLDAAPVELRAGGGRNLWLLNPDREGGQPLYIVAGDGEPAVWFVPEGREQ